MASNTKLFYTSPNEILLNTGDMTNEIYVLKQGMCEMVCPITKKVVSHLKAKSHFGVPECLLRVPAFYTIRACTHVQVFSIKQRHLKSILQNAAIKDTIEFTKKSREFANVMKHHQNPFMTYEPLPNPPNRAIFRMPKKYELDNVFQLPFRQFGLLLQPLRYISPRFTVRPDGKYLRRYEWFRAICAFSCAMLFPSYTYLSIQFSSLYYFKLFLDIAAYFDMLQRFLVGYYNSEGILVYHPASTSAHYIKSAFLVDLLACIPLETLQISYSNLNQVFLDDQLLMLNRLLQLYRFYMTLDELNELLREDILLMLKYIPLFISLCNVMTACVVLFSVYIIIPDDPEALHQWHIVPVEMRSYNTVSWVHMFQHSYRFNLTESPWNIHLAAYFWVISETTTTGYKSVLPTNENLMRILFLGMLANKMITTYFAVSVISCRSNVNGVLCKFQEDLRDLKKFTSQELLHSSLQRKILKYYGYNWEMMGGINSRTVLKMCLQLSLRTDTILQIYGPTFYECPILTHSDASLLRILSRGIYDLHFLHDTEIITEDDVISHMYFINKGSVAITGTFSENFLSAKLNKGSIFGNLDEGRIRIPMKVTAITKVHILQISSDVFHEIIKDFPLVGQLMDRYRPNKECFISAQAAGSTAPDQDEIKSLQRHGTRLEYNDYKLWTKHPLILFYLISVSLTIAFLDTYHAGFQNIGNANLIILYVFDFLFAIKIIALIHVPFKKSSKHRANGILFRKKYLRKAFIWDIISVLPIELLCILAPPQDRMFWFSWLRLNRLFRIPTIYKSLNYFGGQMSINIVATTIGTVLVWISLSLHILSCVWWYISIKEELEEPKSSWRYDNDGISLCDDEYICSLFFMLNTLTHSSAGRIVPRRQSEILFMIFIQMISTVVYMMYVGEFSNITQYTNFRLFAYYKQYLELKNYLYNNRVSANLLQLVNRYALHLWRQSRGEQFPYFLAKAPPPLRLKIMSAIYHNHLDKHPIFKNCEPAFTRQVIGCFRHWTYVDEMNIVREHEINDTMYFIHRGTVKETCEKDSEFKVYNAGEYFGQLQGLVRNTPFTNTYETITASQILTLKLDDWEYLLKFYPKSKALIYGEKSLDDDKPAAPPKTSSMVSLQTVFSNVSKSKDPEYSEPKVDRSDFKRRETLQLTANKRRQSLFRPEALPVVSSQPTTKKEYDVAENLPKTLPEKLPEKLPERKASPERSAEKPERPMTPEKAGPSEEPTDRLRGHGSDATLTPYSEGATWAREEDKIQAQNLAPSISQVIPGNFFSKATSALDVFSPRMSTASLPEQAKESPPKGEARRSESAEERDTDESESDRPKTPNYTRPSLPKYD